MAEHFVFLFSILLILLFITSLFLCELISLSNILRWMLSSLVLGLSSFPNLILKVTPFHLGIFAVPDRFPFQLWFFQIFTKLYNIHHQLTPEHFYHFKRKPIPISSHSFFFFFSCHSSFSLPLTRWLPLTYFLSLFCLFYTFHVNGTK